MHHDILDVIRNIEDLYENNSSLAVLKDFERVLDEMDVYVYENWEDGMVEHPFRQPDLFCCGPLCWRHLIMDVISILIENFRSQKLCPRVWKTLYYLGNLNAHKSYHSKTYSSRECPKRFPTKRKLDDHLNVHEGIKHF